MAWNYEVTKSYGALTTAQKKENALMFFTYFKGYMTLQAIAGILGNIERESQLNPGQIEGDSEYNVGWDDDSRGHGFIQWTGKKNVNNPLLDWQWLTDNNKNWFDGEVQCFRIKCEGENSEGADGTFYPSVTYPEYNYTWSEFCALTDVAEATKAYLHERERAGVSALQERLDSANEWYNFLLEEAECFTPRLDTEEDLISNPIYKAKTYGGYNNYRARKDFSDHEGYGYYVKRDKYDDIETEYKGHERLDDTKTVLPNCTGYAWGRAHEIMGGDPANIPKLPNANAANWYGANHGYERSETTPKLGAIACWSGGAGHVAVVEQINRDTEGKLESIVVSESGYYGGFSHSPRYYYINSLDAKYLTKGAIRSNTLYFQGYIYIPCIGMDTVEAVPAITKPEVVQINEDSTLISCRITSGVPKELFCSYTKTGSGITEILTLSPSQIDTSGFFNFELTGLSPNTQYEFYITAKNNGGSINTETVTFKTLVSLPKPVEELIISTDNKYRLSSSLFNADFKAPSSWGSTINITTRGYRIYLISNGRRLNFFEKIFKNNANESFSFTPNNFLGQNVKTGENLQIGVESFVELSNGERLYSKMVGSNVVYLLEKDFEAYLKAYQTT